MLKQLTYASRATRFMNIMDMNHILKTSRVNNPVLGVTGAMFIHNNTFLQQLEGEDDVLVSLYERIVLDDRHRDATILDLTEIAERRFGNWSMGMLVEDNETRQLFEKYSQNGQFNPYTLSVDKLRAFFNEIQNQTRWVG